jgi:hypothetical protein
MPKYVKESENALDFASIRLKLEERLAFEMHRTTE